MRMSHGENKEPRKETKVCQVEEVSHENESW
jgi:hypothetical protein